MAPRKAEACRAEKEFSRIRHDRTLEVILGLWSYHCQKKEDSYDSHASVATLAI